MQRASTLLAPKPPHTSGTCGFIMPTLTPSRYAEAVVLDYCQESKTYTLAAFLRRLDDPPTWLIVPNMPRARFGVDPVAPVPRMHGVRRGAHCVRTFWIESDGRRRVHEAIVLDVRKSEDGARFVLDIVYRCHGPDGWQVERDVDAANIMLRSSGSPRA